MVRAPILQPDSITQAMLKGEFYASSGVFLSRCEMNAGVYTVEVDEESTRRELTHSTTVRAGFVHEGKPGYRIDFIGPHGIVLATIDGMTARYAIDGSASYVRVVVTLTREYPEHGFEQYYAWGQPVFLD